MTKYPNLKSLNPFYKPYRGRIVMFALFTVLSGGLTFAFPFVSSNIIINLTGGKYDLLVQSALILFALIVLETFLTLTAGWLHAKTAGRLARDIRQSLVRGTLATNLSTVYERGSGFYLERLAEDSREASAVLLNVCQSIINIVINLGFIAYITVLNYMLGLIFAVGLVILIFLEYFRVSAMLKNMKKQKRAVEKVKSNESEILKGIKEIKSLGASEAITEKHLGANSMLVDIRYKREMLNKKLQACIEIVKGVIDLSILLFAALYLLPNQMNDIARAAELAAVLVIYSYKSNVYGLIAGLAKIKDLYVNGELAAKRLNHVINAPIETTDNFGTAALSGQIRLIEFKDIFFEYNPETPVLNGITMQIDKPGVYGFVGKSGSGKSTIFSLLSGFYAPTRGKITVNSTDLRTLTEQSIRGDITMVLQDPYMFNDTIMNNMRLAKPDATDYEIIAACKGAQIHDEILDMKSGYDTMIGENGATISGGQKQRLEIARALLKNTNVILFDEATSALDKKNLDLINNLMIELGKSKMIFVIAHRLGVMRKCDKVFVLDTGTIIAADQHDKLIETCEYYAELFKKSANAEPK